MMKRLIAATLLLLSISSQGSFAGSKFGLNFIGEKIQASDVRSIALGGEVQIVTDSLGVLQKNPAMLIFLSKVTMGACMYVSMDQSKSADYKEREIDVKYPVFSIGVPLSKRIIVGVGYRGRYDPSSSFSVDETSAEGIAYKNVFIKSGGFYSIPLSVALKVTRHLSVGAVYSLEHGSIEDRWEVRFKEPVYAPGLGLKRVELSGSGFGIGVVVLPEGPITVGAGFESKIDYDADIEERFTQAAIDTTMSSKASYPQGFYGAINYRINTSFRILAGFTYRDFQKFEGLDFQKSRLERIERYAIGLEYGGESRLPLRVSASFERLPYDFPENKTVSRYALGLGTGLLFKDKKGKIDIAFQFGKEGSVDRNLLENRFFRVYIGVSGSEEWRRHGIKE